MEVLTKILLTAVLCALTSALGTVFYLENDRVFETCKILLVISVGTVIISLLLKLWL